MPLLCTNGEPLSITYLGKLRIIATRDCYKCKSFSFTRSKGNDRVGYYDIISLEVINRHHRT